MAETNNICVATGAGSGMGLGAVKLIGKDQKVIIAGRTVAKLENALAELRELGIDAEAYPCDASDREAVDKMAAYAASQGTVKTVLHAAGVSPHMTDAEKIFTINALGTINVDEAFSEVMGRGGVILNVASMSAYMLPNWEQFVPLYSLAFTSPEQFLGGFKQVLGQVPAEQQCGMAYTVSKNFVRWYSSRTALRLGSKGIRVVSISPGTFATPMGEIEGDEAAAFAVNGPMGRVGEVEEIARMMAFMVSDECSYLNGVDVLYDGGSVAAADAAKEQAAAQQAAEQA